MGPFFSETAIEFSKIPYLVPSLTPAAERICLPGRILSSASQFGVWRLDSGHLEYPTNTGCQELLALTCRRGFGQPEECLKKNLPCLPGAWSLWVLGGSALTTLGQHADFRQA